MMFAFLPVKASQSLSSKINSTFLTEVCNNRDLIPVMVELVDDPVTVYSSGKFKASHYFDSAKFDYGTNGEDLYRSKLVQKQDVFLKKLQQNGISFSFQYRCLDVLNSLALEVKGVDVKKLMSFSEINLIHDDRIQFYMTRSLASEQTGAKSAWEGVSSLGPITGKGVLVGVLDTGLDKVHMKTGEFVGRVEGGFDVADGDADFDDPAGHGTHVAGIVGGKGKADYQRGMAYEAKFRIYKVFSNGGNGARSVSQAIDRSVREKCKVINMSLGSEGDASVPAKNNPYYGTIVRNATKAGTMVVASAGNSGSRGKTQAFPAGTPGITEEAFCVAATNDRPVNTFTVTTNSSTKVIRLAEASGTPIFDSFLNNTKIVSCGYGKLEDFSEDVSGKIALIQRGPKEDKSKGIQPLTFREKMDNAISMGAKAVLMYNHTPREVLSPTVTLNTDKGDEKFIPTAMMSMEDGLWLLTVLSSDYQLAFSSVKQHSVASFSSMGPTPDGFFKPEITAPGTNILSTVPMGNYSAMSGTSMSSPAVTGLVALLKQAYPTWNVDQIKSAFMNTAEILINPINNLPTTFLLQGAGEARIDRALVTPALINPRALIIQKEKIEPGKLKPDQAVTFTLESNSSSNQKFPLSFQIFGFSEDQGLIDISFNKTTVELPANQKADFSATFVINWEQLTKNSFEGIIQIGEDLHIPFVVFRDSVLKLPEAISNISIGQQELTFSADSEVQDIKIKFSLNSGSEYKASGETDHTNYASIELFVTDEQGENWGTIAHLSGYVVGNYEYHWDGKGIDGKYFLPKGKFYVQFRIMGSNYDDKTTYVYFTTSRNETLKINVLESSVPDPSLALLKGNKIVRMNDIFTVSLLIPEVNQMRGLELELEYDSKKLIGKEVLDAGFLSFDGSSISLEQDIDDDKGLITVKITRDEPSGLSGKYARVIDIVFKAIYTGKLKFSLKTSRILFADESMGRVKLISPDIKISKLDDFLLADLNNDNVVDRYDWALFSEAYPSQTGDSNFNENCDFNQDLMINFEDFLILCKEYGKVV